MLTRPLVKFKREKNKIYPEFLSLKNQEVSEVVSTYVNLAMLAKGRTCAAFEQAKEDLLQTDFTSGLFKVLIDEYIEFYDITSGETFRHKAFLHAQNLRKENKTLTLTTFQDMLTHHMQEDFPSIKQKLYGDLPAERSIKGLKKHITPALLTEAYNRQLLGSILLPSRRISMTYTLEACSTKRSLLHMLKTQRLMPHIEPLSENKWQFLFQTVTSHEPMPVTESKRIVKFIDHCLGIAPWTLQAEVFLKGQWGELSLDTQNMPWVETVLNHQTTEVWDIWQHWPKDGPWTLTQVDAPWQFMPGKYCFPDMIIVHQQGYTIGCELFNALQYDVCLARLQAMMGSPHVPLVLGVERKIFNKLKALDGITAKHLEAMCFIYRDIPTVQNLLAFLDGPFQKNPIQNRENLCI